MFTRILIPLDGSPAAEAALALAELIPSQSARLILIEADTKGPILVTAAEMDAWRAEREATSLAYLERAGQELRRQGRAVESTFAFGDPAAEIIRAAADADLIAMSTHGRGAGGRIVFGSVADRVSRHAPTATLLVRAGGGAPTALTRLVVPLDGSPLAETALPVAATLAGDLELPVHLLRVVEHDFVRASIQAGAFAAAADARFQETINREAETYVSGQVQRLRNRDLAATGEARTGTPAEGLLAAIEASDLVVMTTHGRGGVRRWLLGSVRCV